MGLSASQARLLTLTSRLSDLELKAQQISNSKMRLATQSEEVARKYYDALDKRKLEVFAGYQNNNEMYNSLNYNNLTGLGAYNNLGMQYGITNNSGKLLVSKEMADIYKSANGDLNAFLEAYGENGSSATVYPNGYQNAQEALAEAEKKHIDFVNGDYADYKNATAATITAKTEMDAIGKAIIKNYKEDTVTETPDSGETQKPFKTSYSDSKVWEYLGERKTNNDYLPYNKDGSSNVIKLAEIEFSGDNADITGLQNIMATRINTISTDVGTALKNILGITSNDSNIQTALEYAKNATQEYYKNDIAQKSAKNSDDHFGTWLDRETKKTQNRAAEQNGIAISDGFSAKEHIYIDLSQIVKTFLNFFDAKCAELKGDNELRDKYLAQVGDGGTANKPATRNQSGGTDPIVRKTGETQEVERGSDPSVRGTEKTTVTWDYDPAKVTYLDGVSNEQKTSYAQAYQKWQSCITNEETITNAINSKYSVKSPEEALKTLSSDIETKKAYFESLGGATTSTSKGENAEYYENIFNKMQTDGFFYQEDEASTTNNEAWIQGQLLNSNLCIDKVINGKWERTSISTESGTIDSESDDLAVKKAEAEYNLETSKIQNKDKRYDLELKQIDSEHSMVQTEVDSVKKVIDKNIERNFKLFEA